MAIQRPTGLAYARQLVELHGRAQIAMRGSTVSGKVAVGVPDDYVCAYLAPVLRAYATRFCDVDISLVCEPSSSLLPRIDRGELDLAPVTRHMASRGVPDQGVFLFEEHLVWAASEQHEAWKRDPLPLALHELGSHLRTEVLSAVSAMGREYRVVYGSPNMRGQIATTESGLAVAVMSRCCVPPSLKILDSRQGLPALPKMEVALVRSKDSARSLAVDMLYSEVLNALQQDR